MTSDHRLALGHGLELRCSMDALDDSIQVAIAWHARVLRRQRFSRTHDHDTLRIALPFLRIELGLWVDVFAGEIEGEVEIAARPFFGGWRKLLDSERRVLVRFDPAVGAIGGSLGFSEPIVDHPDYGRSRLCTPAILRLHVDAGERAISDAGRLVKETLFARHPAFVFNTIACVGPAGADGKGAYPNPDSIWFNVFFGCYQIDAAKSDWSRPFGYVSADGPASRIEFDDVARLGEADWNFFSNWMYGVPRAAIDPYNVVDPVQAVQAPAPQQVGNTLWHRASVDGVKCVSTYESEAAGADRLVTNTLIDAVWRRAFGLPNPRPGWPQSFVPTTIRAELHMAYSEDADAFHTVICGGTAQLPVDRAFLDAQLAAIRKVMEARYADCGFPP